MLPLYLKAEYKPHVKYDPNFAFKNYMCVCIHILKIL